MKIRSDFVTNSSSSSFIISTKQKVPQQHEADVRTVTSENLAEILSIPFQYDTICWNDENLQRTANLTDEQMGVIKLAVNNELETYQKIMNILLTTNEKLYNIYEDRDWLYEQGELNDFISSGTILYRETDL